MGNSIKSGIKSGIRSNAVGHKWSEYVKWVTGKGETAELKMTDKTGVFDFLWDGSELISY
jgi:hypothetical protein